MTILIDELIRTYGMGRRSLHWAEDYSRAVVTDTYDVPTRACRSPPPSSSAILHLMKRATLNNTYYRQASKVACALIRRRIALRIRYRCLMRASIDTPPPSASMPQRLSPPLSITTEYFRAYWRDSGAFIVVIWSAYLKFKFDVEAGILSQSDIDFLMRYYWRMARHRELCAHWCPSAPYFRCNAYAYHSPPPHYMSIDIFNAHDDSDIFIEAKSEHRLYDWRFICRIIKKYALRCGKRYREHNGRDASRWGVSSAILGQCRSRFSHRRREAPISITRFDASHWGKFHLSHCYGLHASGFVARSPDKARLFL